MAGVLKVIGAIAGVVAMIPSPIQPIAAAVSAVATIGAGLLAKPPPVQGTVNNIVIAMDGPAQLVLGRSYIGGQKSYDQGYGGKVSKVWNPYRFIVNTYGIGPCQNIEAYCADFAVLSRTGAQINGFYQGWLYNSTSYGERPSGAVQPQWSGAPGWNATSKLSGKVTIGWSAKFDKEGEKWASGFPQLGIIEHGPGAYDPRYDSTVPGGSGPCRAHDRGTWRAASYTNPACQRLSYILGLFDNGVKIFGIGAALDSIDLQAYIAWANVCDANNWRVNGVLEEKGEDGERWDNLNRIAIAGGAKNAWNGGRWSIAYNAPRVSLYTITADDLSDESGKCEAVGASGSRPNIVIPKFRSPDHQWEMTPGSAIEIAALIAQDGEKRSEEITLELVTDATQAAQLATYHAMNGRELGPITITCKPHMRHFSNGDKLTLDLPDEGFAAMPVIITSRTIDPATSKVTFILISENEDKHDFAMGRTTVMPPPVTLTTPEERHEAYLTSQGPVAADDVYYADGQTAEGLQPGQAGADVTGDNVAAGFEGAGALAYQNNVDAATQLVGKVNIQNVADEMLNSKISLTNTGGNVTLTGAGGGSFNLGSLGAKALALRDAVGFSDGSILESPGVTAMLANFKTNQGISAGFTGQGPWATTTTPIGSVLSPGANLFKYPRPLNDGRTVAQQGWVNGERVNIWNDSKWGGYIYIISRASGGGGEVLVPFFDTEIIQEVKSYAVSCNGVGSSASFLPYVDFIKPDYTWNGSAGMAFNALTGRYEWAGNVPSGTKFIRFVVRAEFPASASYQDVFWYGIKVECGARVTPYTDNTNAIVGGDRVLWNNGQPLNTLKPSEAGANVTGNNIAAGFNGQGPWATTSTPIGTVLAPGANLVRYPRPTGDGTSMAAMGWLSPDAMGAVYALQLGGWVYVYSRPSGGAAQSIYPQMRMDISEYSANYAFSLSGYCGSGTFNPYVEYLDVNGDWVAHVPLALNPATNRWEGAAARPTNARKVQIVCNAIFNAASGYQDMVIWGIKVESGSIVTPYTDSSNQVISGNLIVDGTIISRMLATDAVTTRELASNAVIAENIAAGNILGIHIGAYQVTADKISVNNLAALSASLGMITAGSININNRFIVNADGSVIIRSAASGKRFELRDNGFRSYNDAGVEVGRWIVT